jgi:hypothetical protein
VLDKGLADPHVSNCINIEGGTHAEVVDCLLPSTSAGAGGNSTDRSGIN